MTLFLFFKQKTAYEVRMSDGSSDVCSSDLAWPVRAVVAGVPRSAEAVHARAGHVDVDPGRRGDAVPDDGHAWAGGVGVVPAQDPRPLGDEHPASIERID